MPMQNPQPVGQFNSLDYYVIERDASFPLAYAVSYKQAELRAMQAKIDKPNAEWSIVTTGKFMADQEAAYLNQPVRKITGDRFDELLGCTPPMNWVTEDGIERFSMMEHMVTNITMQVARYGDKHYTKYVRVGDKSTYFNRDTILPQ